MKNLFTGMLLLTAMGATAQEARLLRFPTTNGQEVVFTYAGDLYKAPISGGQAVRLTSHIGTEAFAKFSPDGKTLAFSAQYDGNTEVYTMPSNGGEPQRLTYTATNSRDDLGDRMGPNNMVMGWNPDGNSIIYRNRISTGFDGNLWTISTKGGMSQKVNLPEGGFCCYSPNGKQLAYNRTMREFRTWKYYRGGQADDIWVYDPQAKIVKNVTNNDAQDIMPMWIGDEIYYISDRDHTMNIFVYNTKTQQTEKVTNFTDYDVKFPSTNGKMIVFEKGGYLYSLNPVGRQVKQINIQLNAEGVYARTQKMDLSKNITAFSLNNDASRMAITARGEVFTVPVAKGVTRNITRTPGSNDRGAVYSPDGKYVAYIGDQTGETEVYLYTVESGETTQLTKKNDTYIRSLQWTPDSKTLLYTDRKNRLVSLDPVAKSKKVLLTSDKGEYRISDISADSKWLVYTRPAENQMSVVIAYNLQSGKEIAITEKWYNAGSPKFSTDGKYLIFTADRDFNPTYGSLEWNHTYNNLSGIYMTMLAKDTPSPLLPTDGEKTGKRKPGKDDAKEGDAGVNVTIDAEGIFDRQVKLRVGGWPIYCDGKKLWFSAQGGTKVLSFDTMEEDNIASASMSVQNGKAIFMEGGRRGGGKVYVMDNIPSGKANLSKAIDLSDMEADIDYKQEWAQIFNEAWRAFRDGFYLENMHGVDWEAVKAKYEVMVPFAKTRLDLNYLIGEMIGELTCGHCYVNPGKYAQAEKIDMGLLGAEISRDKSGYYKIEHILKGAPYSKTLRSPLTEPGMNINEGDYITAIDGISVTTTENIYSMLINKADRLTELTINTKAAAGGRKVVVKPISDEYPLYHYEWVQKNIEYVNKKSNGKIGYVYIPDMGPEGLNEFARYFYAQLDKEALIVDDRANGGGNVSPMILERLLREPYRLTMRRGSSLIGTIPDATLVGPKVCLVNKYSASDGDLFPWSFKATKAGKVIGTRTWGGIVGISGSLPYMDGTDIRVPFFTNYDYKTGQWIVENHGVDPDIIIDNDPIKEAAGIDQQLDKAIEVLLEEIKTRKPIPGVPAPRNFSKVGLE